MASLRKSPLRAEVFTASVCDNLITLGSEIKLLSELSLGMTVCAQDVGAILGGRRLARSKCVGGLDGRVGAVRFSEV